MTRAWRRAVMGMVMVVGLVTLAAMTQPAGSIRVLVIDETKTFLSTMRVAGLVGALRGSGLFQVDVRLADVSNGFEDPLAGVEVPDGQIPYSMAVIVSRGVDVGVFPYVWILNGGVEATSPGGRIALDVLTQIAGGVFAGIAIPLGAYDDLFPALLWALYVQEGWMT